MTGIQDVAKRAGVSTGTVSRVLNNSGYASEESRRKVLEAVKVLQYRPNELARNLLQNSTRTIAVIVPTLLNPYYCEVTEASELALAEKGYMTMICSTNGSGSTEQKYLDMLNRNMVDGILTCTHSLNMEKYKQVQGAIVSIDMMYVPGRIGRVTVDHKNGGIAAARELYHAGCHRVLQFRDKAGDDQFPYLERHTAFEKEAEQLGMECVNSYVRWNEFSENYRDTIARENLDRYLEVDGIFGTDTTILSCMKYAQMKGKKIPDEIHFVAYDGTQTLRNAYPTVTAVCQPLKELACCAVDLLLKMIESGRSDPAEHPAEKIYEDHIVLPVSVRRGMSTMTPDELRTCKETWHSIAVQNDLENAV